MRNPSERGCLLSYYTVSDLLICIWVVVKLKCVIISCCRCVFWLMAHTVARSWHLYNYICVNKFICTLGFAEMPSSLLMIVYSREWSTRTYWFGKYLHPSLELLTAYLCYLTVWKSTFVDGGVSFMWHLANWIEHLSGKIELGK